MLTLLYPPRCASCARELRRTPPLGLCRGCLAELGTIGPGCPSCGEPGSTAPCARCRRAPPAFRSARACFVYREGALSSSLVTRWKYQRDHVLGAALAALLAAHRKRQADCYDVVVPVPLHASRLVTRGFNQAALLAQAVRLPGERVAARALHRASRTPPQAALDRAARERNVAAAFAADDAAALGGRSVLLIDDVLTTGATARACAAALRSAGAAVVDVWTLARTARPLGPAAVTPGRPAATQPADVPT